MTASSSGPGFVPGRELNAAFYTEVVAPLLGRRPYAAALLGTGSDVLGYDTEVSTDHDWGPRLLVFAAAEEVDAVQALIDTSLPERFRGWPVHFGSDRLPVRHHITACDLGGWLRGQLGTDPREAMSTVDWLTIPQQMLLEVTSGQVYADPDGELGRVRRLVARFPPDVRRWMLACQWVRIGQEEAFVGRSAQVGDELGSRLLAGRLARELMRLGFLLADEYWPYPKWFGTAFARLPITAELAPALERAVAATGYPERESALVTAYETVARAHNASGLTEPVDPTVRRHFDRPFRVLGARRFAEACHATIADPWLRELPRIGSVDQIADSTDVLGAIGVASRLRALYRATPAPD